MKKYIQKLLTVLLCLLIMTASLPANAQVIDRPKTAIAIFYQLYAPLGLINCDGTTTHNLQFLSGTTAFNQSLITNHASSYDWTGNDIYAPDVIGFFKAIAKDQNLPAAARTQLPLAQAIMSENISDQNLIDNYIIDMLTSGAYPWLSMAAVQEILTVAAQYGINISVPTVPAGTPNLTGLKLSLLQDQTIPPTAKLHLLTYASTLTDLIGYNSVTNTAVPISAAATVGSNVVVSVLSVDASMTVGAFCVVTDGTNTEIENVLATTPTSITLSALQHNYAAGSTVQACTLLEDAWLGIATVDTQVNAVTCLDGVSLVNKVQNTAKANSIDLSPLQ